MLKDTIKRYDPDNKLIKFVSIDNLKSIPPQIHSVPALVEKGSDGNITTILFGKQVFDYLILPGKGKLMSVSTPETEVQISTEPNYFAFGKQVSYTDSFANFNENSSSLNVASQPSGWATFDNSLVDTDITPNVILQEDTRPKKDLIDLDSYRMQRDLEINQNDLNKTQLPIPIPSSTRK